MGDANPKVIVKFSFRKLKCIILLTESNNNVLKPNVKFI